MFPQSQWTGKCQTLNLSGTEIYGKTLRWLHRFCIVGIFLTLELSMFYLMTSDYVQTYYSKKLNIRNSSMAVGGWNRQELLHVLVPP
jgi:hypothetical protein